MENEIINEQDKNGVDTASTSQEEIIEKTESEKVDDTKTDEPKNFTQDQVNEFIRERLERDRKSLFSRYGVDSRDKLDELVGKSQSYDIMKERYEGLTNENKELKDKITFMTNNINKGKETEIKALFKGLELEFNEENLLKMLETHPEWLNVAERKEVQPKTTISNIGVNHEGTKKVGESASEKEKRIFGI